MTNEVERYQDTSYMRSLWLALLAGPVVWIVYFFSGYLLNEVACTAGWFQATISGLPLLPVITVAYTLLALGLVAYAGSWAYRQWQILNRQRDEGTERMRPAAGEQIDVRERSRFVTFAGMLLSLLFGLTILLTGIPSLVLRSCG
jgi:hypothetical protein